jgi:hypothetical protein
VKRKAWVLAGGAVLLAATATGGAAATSSAKQATPATQESAANTATVERGPLATMVSLFGTLTYRARSDGSPYAVVNQARGTYTELPVDGDKVDCGDVLYRVHDNPVLLLCGTLPAYRGLRSGDVGNDVRQLNRSLHELGVDAAVGVVIDPNDDGFTWMTRKALEKLQHDKGFDATGRLAIGDVVFLPESVRIAKVTGALGALARPGAQVMQATSDTLEVQVSLDPSQQGVVKEGDRAQITLPGNRWVAGKVDRLGRVAQVPAGQDGAQANPGDATIPAYISLDDPATVRGLDRAPVQVDITTTGVDNALSVPVTALVGKAGGGFAVEVVRAGGRRELVAVKLGLFDATGGRVQVEGRLHEGDRVVLPSS